ncbi:MAG: hypothetical protein ABII02_03980 [Candidatus Magasanikbacteria bacterium]
MEGEQQVFVIGASDPEADSIVRKLRRDGRRVEYALGSDRQRVHPGIAYEAVLPPPGDNQVWIETTPRGGFNGARVIRVDHHSPGDPGYGLDYTKYWRASSLGQVSEICGWIPTHKDLVVAAADHCLYEAYQGRCVGVKPSDVLSWQLSETVRRFGLTYQQDTDQMKIFEEVLRKKTPIALEDSSLKAYLFEEPFREFWRFLCLREVCFLHGVAYVTYVVQGGGDTEQTKICISGNVTKDFIKGFLAGLYFAGVRGQRHGCPTRRYAVLVLDKDN